MDRLEAMSTLVAAVDAGSLSAASRKLRIPLATVSRRVSDLEKHVRAQLLIRTSRRLELTNAGSVYVSACRAILASVHEAERAAAGEYSEPRGQLVVSAPIVFGRLHVLPVVTAFLKTYPKIDVRLMLTDRMTDFAEDGVDIALRIGALPDSGLLAVTVGSVSRVVCASPAYLEAARQAIERPVDLGAHECITFEGQSSPLSWTFGRGRSASSVRVKSRLVVNTAEAAVDAAIAGVGVTRVLSYQADEAVKRRRLVRVLREFEPEPVPVNLVYAAQAPMPLKLRAFIDFAAGRLRNAGAAERHA